LPVDAGPALYALVGITDGIDPDGCQERTSGMSCVLSYTRSRNKYSTRVKSDNGIVFQLVMQGFCRLPIGAFRTKFAGFMGVGKLFPRAVLKWGWESTPRMVHGLPLFGKNFSHHAAGAAAANGFDGFQVYGNQFPIGGEPCELVLGEPGMGPFGHDDQGSPSGGVHLEDIAAEMIFHLVH
jgi:hypothetical protein